MKLLILESQDEYHNDSVRLPNEPLGVLHLGGVYIARALPGKEFVDPAPQLDRGDLRDVALAGQPADEVDVTAHVVVEDSEVAARHVGDSDLITVGGQLVED